MPEAVKIDRRVNLGSGAGFEHRAVLFGLLPLPTVGLRKDQVALTLAGTAALEKPATFVGQIHVVDLHAAIALPGSHTDSPGVTVEILYDQPGELAVSGA